MSTTGSPAGESATTGTVVPFDSAKHRVAERGTVWDTLPGYDGVSVVKWVILLDRPAEPERSFTSDELAALPWFLRDSLEPRPGPRDESLLTAANVEKPAPKPKKGAPRKLLYGEALASGRPDLTDKELLLLFAMWRYADNTSLGDVFPGHTALAEAVGLSGKSGREKVRIRIGSLVRKGYVVEVSRGRSVPTKRAAVYRLTLPEWEALSS